ncbi:MAG: Holliday junction branch migration protein RuvA [Gemmobacter sp.]|jgi:Holliday junction DNA helicase RuvA|nr:Holliday junction branch migration protein RuvA [Gemmobacter sp.]
MIGRIAGRIDWRGADHVLIDVRGVGYIVHVSDRTLAALPVVGEACALYTELVVREDLLQLFGFPTMLEKEWHRLLITVQGVGAKAALAILGTLGAEGTGRAIALGDAKAIQAAPGIGPKIAQRVVMELKAKAPLLMARGATLRDDAPLDDVTEPAVPRSAALHRGTASVRPEVTRAARSADALSALLNLGYGQSDAAQAVATAAGEAPDADTADLIRRALKLLMPKG